jgi:hypothetical protein
MVSFTIKEAAMKDQQARQLFGAWVLLMLSVGGMAICFGIVLILKLVTSSTIIPVFAAVFFANLTLTVISTITALVLLTGVVRDQRLLAGGNNGSIA